MSDVCKAHKCRKQQRKNGSPQGQTAIKQKKTTLLQVQDAFNHIFTQIVKKNLDNDLTMEAQCIKN